MRKLILVFTLYMLFAGCADHDQPATTFILMRHAEKANDGSDNPPLSEEGILRASALAEILEEASIDAIYSTNFIRTRSTVEPLAKSKNLEILDYDPKKTEELDVLLQNHRGKTVVLCGHSNTTPSVVNHFIGENRYSDLADSDYDDLIILTIFGDGNSQVTWLNYGSLTN